MSVEEVIGQPFYQEDQLLKKVIEICMAAYDQNERDGFIAHQLASKFDGQLSFLYYKQLNHNNKGYNTTT